MTYPPWTTEAGNADVAMFAQYGVLGVFAAILLWFARGSVQRERERADRLEAENLRLNQAIQERVIPALTAASRAAEEATALLAAMQRERELMRLAEQRRSPPREDDGGR